MMGFEWKENTPGFYLGMIFFTCLIVLLFFVVMEWYLNGGNSYFTFMYGR